MAMSDQCCPPESYDAESCAPEAGDPKTIHLTEGEAAELADLTKALGHPTRIAILKALLAGGRCQFGSLAAKLDYAQSTVSQHFKILREAGLVEGEVEGVSVCYCAVPKALDRLRELLGRF